MKLDHFTEVRFKPLHKLLKNRCRKLMLKLSTMNASNTLKNMFNNEIQDFWIILIYNGKFVKIVRDTKTNTEKKREREKDIKRKTYMVCDQ